MRSFRVVQTAFCSVIRVKELCRTSRRYVDFYTGVSVSSSNTGVPDISGSVYNKAQTFDKQAFHAGTPPPFNLPSALATAGPMNPAAAGYAPAPFLHILPHQQAHSQMLHHHLQQDGQGISGPRSQQNAMQQKSQANKTAYASSPYWTN